MTVRNASHYKHLNNYYGLSTDTKPTHTDTGDTFQELDGEQLKYIFNGTIWELYNEDGIDATGVAVPTGASGIRGWLSGIYNVLKNTSLSIINKNSSGTEIFTDSNPGSIKLTGSSLSEQLMLKHIADDLPFINNIVNFETPNNPIITVGGAENWDGSTSGLHHPKIYYNSAWPECWRVYYSGLNAAGVVSVGFASAANPTGTWTKNVNNPILTVTENFENSTYGVSGLVFTHVNGQNVGFYQYKDTTTGLVTSAKVISTDGIVWTNKTPCIFDEKLTIYNSIKSITGVIWETENQRFIACMHCSGTNKPLIGAVVASTDGINWTTLSVLNANVSYGASVFNEPFDTFGISKTGSTYVVFAHRWVNINYGGGNKDFKTGCYGVSTDLKNWWLSEKPTGLSQYPARDSGRYQNWALGHDAWWGVHTTGTPLSISLMRLPIIKPYHTYIFDEATITNGTTAPALTRYIYPSGSTKKLKITAQIKYGIVLGAVKIKITPLITLMATPYGGVPVTTPIEITIPETSTLSYSRIISFINDVPDAFTVSITNSSGADITNVTLRISFQD